MIATSQYRCETCENRKCIWHIDNPHAYSGIPPHNRRTMASCAAERFSTVCGCMHHSDYYNILDELFHMLEVDKYHRAFILDENAGLMTFSIQDIEQYITELKGEL